MAPCTSSSLFTLRLYQTLWEPGHGWQHIIIPLKLDKANTSGEFTDNKDNMARPCGGLEARLRKPLGNTEAILLAFPDQTPPCSGEKWPPEAHIELRAPVHSSLESEPRLQTQESSAQLGGDIFSPTATPINRVWGEVRC